MATQYAPKPVSFRQFASGFQHYMGIDSGTTIDKLAGTDESKVSENTTASYRRPDEVPVNGPITRTVLPPWPESRPVDRGCLRCDRPPAGQPYRARRRRVSAVWAVRVRGRHWTGRPALRAPSATLGPH